eukprot:TRINITY_DN77226_c0_g1_i1.p1 TRINITY_DN77226_c0_g1~~TRINITY_DN77226_c0_g1_i1.p1  ORF type:complete len:518 (+),score=93.16 TRINITY_DN77226_c0_g1_i1:173-1555(+)
MDASSVPHQDGAYDSADKVRGDDELRSLDGGAVRVDLLNNNNSQYYGDFMLGNPGQRFTAVFDTGSGITWVPGTKCTSDTCAEHHRFSTDSSHSFEEQQPSKADGTIHYGTGQVQFSDGRDAMTFCDSSTDPGCHSLHAKRLKVPSQPFGMSTNQTDYPFRILPFDGILGLAPSASSGSVMHALKKGNALDRNLFGVYLSEDAHRNGSIDFGGIERARIHPKSPLTWHKIRGDQEWSLAMKDILVDGKPLHICDDRPDGTCPAVVDTGSSLITGPRAEVEKLLSQVRLKDDCSNLATLPTVSIRMADKDGTLTDYPLTPQEYTLKSLDEVPQTGNAEYLKEFPVLGGSGDKVPEVKAHCDPGLGVMDVPGQKWVIGDTFLRRYYSIYDDDRGLVGFARSIHPDEAVELPASTVGLSTGASQPGAATKAASMETSLCLLAPCVRLKRRRQVQGRPAWTSFL